MTDNRTTELLLDMLYAFLIDYQNILKAAISEEISEKETIARQRAIVREHAERIEQAIAATLGAEYHRYEQAAIEAWESIKAWNERATHGTLTAEQVRKAIRKYAEDDSCYIFEVYGEMCGPIADELNARAERTCEYVIEDNMNESEGMGDVWFRCTNCDMCFDYADDWLLKMPYCPHCGARVKARNE